MRWRGQGSSRYAVPGIALALLDLRDHITARHSTAVAGYAREIAIEAGFDAGRQQLVHSAALLHDIGKFVFPDRILRGEPLQADDWTIVMQHPKSGADVLRRVKGFEDVADIVLAHHERIDGLGYPNGLRDDEISEEARIISVADTYDVMTARASYQRAYRTREATREEALAELERVAGSQLDARFVDVMAGLVAAGKIDRRDDRGRSALAGSRMRRALRSSRARPLPAIAER